VREEKIVPRLKHHPRWLRQWPGSMLGYPQGIRWRASHASFDATLDWL